MSLLILFTNSNPDSRHTNETPSDRTYYIYKETNDYRTYYIASEDRIYQVGVN